MNLKPEELAENNFELLDSLGHKELIPFVQLYLKKWTRSTILYLVSNVLALLLILFWFWKNSSLENFLIGDGISFLSYGFGIAFALVPLHVFIHVLAYKSQGAKQTSYDANLRKFYFMAMADKFVANRKEFQIVALAPFTVISISLLILLLFAGQLWSFTILGIFMIHTAFCSGDFALLSYFDFHKEKYVVTFDDKEN
jgi:Putative zincin peptidase